MKIQGLPFGANRARNAEGTQKTEAANDNKRLEKSADQGSVVEKDSLVEAGYAVEPEFEPRVERMELVSSRISAGDYHSPAVREAVARKLVETSVEPQETQDVVVEPEPVSTQRLESIGENISAAFYESEDIVKAIAERIAPVLGLSTLFEPSSE